MNRQQVRLKFWPHADAEAAIQRLRELTQAGYLRCISIDALRYSANYFLTKAGAEVLAAHGHLFEGSEQHLATPTDVVTNSFFHDMRVTDIRIKMETDPAIRIVRWVSETYIRADRSGYGVKSSRTDKLGSFRIPDALCQVECRYKGEATEINLLLEYENQAYKTATLNKYLEVWESTWHEYQKLIVCAGPERIGELQKHLKAGLAKLHRVDINRGKLDMAELMEAYLITDFRSLMKHGLTGHVLNTPAGQIQIEAN